MSELTKEFAEKKRRLNKFQEHNIKQREMDKKAHKREYNRKYYLKSKKEKKNETY